MWQNLNSLIKWLKKREIFFWQNILKNPNDATFHIFRLPRVNILVCIVVASVVANVVTRMLKIQTQLVRFH
jgi:Na+/melibiose symporter-like transporter